MKVKLERVIADYTTHRRVNLYAREDGRYFVLAVPTNPDLATIDNVHEAVCDTREQALALCEAEVS